MREQIEQHRKAAEQTIAEALQKYHSTTGLIPTSIDFDMLEVSTVTDKSNGINSYIVQEVHLHSQT